VPLAARLLEGELPPEGAALATRLIWVMLPVVLFGGGAMACRAVLNAEKSFFIPAMASSFGALAVILAVLAVGRAHATYAQAVGLSLGALLEWTVLMALLWKKGLANRWMPNLHADGVRHLLQLVWPLNVTRAFILCVPIVDRTMAARFSPGSISSLAYAQTLMGVSVALLLDALHKAILPFLSQQIAEDGIGTFRETFVSTLRVLVGLVFPLTVVLIVLREPVVQLALQRGAFDAKATASTASAFGLYLAGAGPMAICLVCARGFNALQDSRTNALVGIVFLVAAKLMMNVVLAGLWGYLGLAAATSGAYLLAALAMLVVMGRRLKGIEWRRLLHTSGKVVAISVVGGLLAVFGANVGRGSPLLQLVFGGTLGVVGCGVTAYLLRLEEIRGLTGLAARLAWARGYTVFRRIVHR